MGRIKIRNSSLTDLGTIYGVFSSDKTEKINSDYVLNFTTPLASAGALISGENIAEVDSDYFDIVAFKKAQASNGELSVSVECEHVSYRLNDPEYNMEYFTQTGTPTAILTALLAGTGFTVGTVDFTDEVTYSAQEAKSRRALLMEFVAYLGGEVEFNQFTIGIRAQRGSAVPKDLLIDRNIEVISISYSKRDRDAQGNPLVCYECNLIRPMAIALGDVVTLNYSTLGIDAELRVVSITTDPYHPDDVSFEIGNFTPGLADDAYRIETSTVVKDKLYNGCRIGPEFGFENILSNKKARSYFNATGGAWQIGDGSGSNWIDKLFIYVDPETGAAKLMFDGELTANVVNAIKANIDIVISNTIITQNLYAQYGVISELTVDEVNTSKIKTYNYLHSIKTPVNYTHRYEQHDQWITATYSPRQHWTDYPNSPEDSATYPYQAIVSAGTNTRLIISSAKWYYYFSGDDQLKSSVAGKMYQLTDGAWVYQSDATNYSYTTILQANADIYTNSSLNVVHFAATCGDYEQLRNRNGDPVYWVDDTHTGTTMEETAYPVYVYVYDELVKMELSFYDANGNYRPHIVMGAGVGNTENPDWGKFFIDKDEIGGLLSYVTSTGATYSLRIGENGLEFLGDTSNNYYSATNTTQVTVNSSGETVVCTKNIAFSSRSKAIINFSCTILTATGALNATAKVYVDGVALTMQPKAYQATANSWIISFTDDVKAIAAGTKTVAVKVVTDANSGTIAVGQSKMIVQVFVDPMPALAEITSFVATVISDVQINLAWSNPVNTYFTGVEVYRHTSDLASHDRAWCAVNATSVYTGTGTSYNNTGLTASTTYYYKIFAVHANDSGTYYSGGVTASGQTQAPIGATSGYSFGGLNANSSTTQYVPDTWTNKTNMPAPGRYGFGACTLSSKAYVFCGGTGTRDCDEYSPDTWTSKTDAPLPARYYNGVFGINNKGYSTGGLDTSANYLSDTDEYTPDTWASKANMPSPARREVSGCTINNAGYVIGGKDANDYRTDCDQYTPDTWTSKPDMPSPIRSSVGACEIGNKGYVFGGFGVTWYRDCDEYSPDTWTSKTDMPSPARMGVGACRIGTKGYSFYGYSSSTYYRDCDEYSPDTWTSKTDGPVNGRYLVAATSI